MAIKFLLKLETYYCLFRLLFYNKLVFWKYYDETFNIFKLIKSTFNCYMFEFFGLSEQGRLPIRKNSEV